MYEVQESQRHDRETTVNFTTKQVRDTCTRTVTVELTGAPDTASTGGPSAYTLRPDTAELSYTWNGWMFELYGVSVRGPRIKRDGEPGTRTGTLAYLVLVTAILGELNRVIWGTGTPAWVHIVGARYPHPHNPPE